MLSTPLVTFNNGLQMPAIGLGTYMSTAGELKEAVKYAIDIGYRHIDTAALYQNEEEIGNAVREKIEDGTIKREDIFITTKLWCTAHKESQVVPACKKSLKNLGLDYIDLYLVHMPFAFKEGDELWPRDSSGKLQLTNTDYLETWKGMEDCKRLGLVRSIGVSNFNSEQISRLLESAKIKPVNNQIEISINLNQKYLINFCKRHDITVTAYSPLGMPSNSYGIKNSWDHPKFQRIVEKYKKTPAQIACRFVYQMGAVPIPKSVTKSRIKENFEIFNFELTDEDMNSIISMETGIRVVMMEECAESPYYPFNVPYEKIEERKKLKDFSG